VSDPSVPTTIDLNIAGGALGELDDRDDRAGEHADADGDLRPDP
jgi:hypothetical protein